MHGYIGVLFICIHPSCLRMPTTHSFVLAIAMPKEQEQGSSVSTVTVNDGSGAAISPSVNQLIKSSVAESIGALTDNLTRVQYRRSGRFR